MAMTLIIIATCSVLFVYWFRYTALLILQTRREAGLARKVAVVNCLSFTDLQESLRRSLAGPALNGMLSSLKHDYTVLKGMRQSAVAPGMRQYTLEERVLIINFRLLTLWSSLTRRFRSDSSARGTLLEMCDILGYFADTLGRLAPVTTRG